MRRYRRTLPGLLTLALVLLALGLRLYCLDAQSYWSDEGASVNLALGSLEDIAPKSAADIHPPLYYYLLWGWVRLVGPGEFATRSLSALAGTLLVALTFAVGRRSVGTRAALIGTFLCAGSPLLIYYSQEARMYELMALWGALSAGLLLLLVARNRMPDAGLRFHFSRFTFDDVGFWLAYVLVATLGLYTQYFFFTVLLWQNIYVLYHVLRFTSHALRFMLSWLVAQVIIGALFLPWALRVKDQLAGWPSFGKPFALPDLLRRVFVGFTFGPAAPETLTGKAELALWGLIALSLVVIFWAIVREWRPVVGGQGPPVYESPTLIALYLSIPIAVVYVLSQNRPLDKPDFLKQILAAVPAYCLFLGQGIAGAGRLVEWVPGRLGIGRSGWGAWSLGLGFSCLVLVALTFFTGRALNACYHNPKYARDDYRGLAAFIAASEQPGDAIILNAPGQIEIFELYYRGPAPRYPLPRQRPIDEGLTRADLETIAGPQGHGRVWLVLWAVEESDPGRFVEGWLDAHAYKTLERWYGNVRLVLYQVGTGGGITHPLRLRLGEAIALLGYSLPPEARAGEIVPLTLFWQAQGAVTRRYKVFAHVVDGQDYLWGQRDAEPAGNARPTVTWTTGEIITDTYGLLVLPGTPPGTYQVEIGMYGLEDGVRLPVYDAAGAPQGDRVLLGPLTVVRPVTPPPTAALLIPHPLDHDLGGGFRLLGYSLTLWGESEERAGFAPGQVALLTLFWRVTNRPNAAYRVRVQLLDEAGHAVFTRETAPGNAPATSWQPDDVVRDQHRLGPFTAPGLYHLAVTLVSEDGRALERVELGTTVLVQQ